MIGADVGDRRDVRRPRAGLTEDDDRNDGQRGDERARDDDEPVGSDQPLTPPTVNPVRKYRCSPRKSAITGTETMSEAAAK